MTYTVYFQIYGKRMKTTVSAKNKSEAQQKVKDSIVFDKITLVAPDFDEARDIMDFIQGVGRK